MWTSRSLWTAASAVAHVHTGSGKTPMRGSSSWMMTCAWSWHTRQSIASPSRERSHTKSASTGSGSRPREHDARAHHARCAARSAPVKGVGSSTLAAAASNGASSAPSVRSSSADWMPAPGSCIWGA